MDPNETLIRLRKEIANSDNLDADTLVELFEALDGWLCKGGFLPTDWQPPAAELTDNDHLVGDGETGPYFPTDLSISLGADVHLRSETPIVVRLHTDQQRAVVRFGVCRACLDLFADAGQIDRLITVLTAAKARLH